MFVINSFEEANSAITDVTASTIVRGYSISRAEFESTYDLGTIRLGVPCCALQPSYAFRQWCNCLHLIASHCVLPATMRGHDINKRAISLRLEREWSARKAARMDHLSHRIKIAKPQSVSRWLIRLLAFHSINDVIRTENRDNIVNFHGSLYCVS